MQRVDAPRGLVTGAFSNTGSAVAAELLRRGWSVATLTNRAPKPGDDPRIERHPLRFDREYLRQRFSGIDAFVNTYWVRFPYRGTTFQSAVDNSMLLLDSAREGGVRRFVQVSVSNAGIGTGLGYYEGKARVDEAVRASGMSHAIVSPTLIVGPNDVLTNNIAYFLRRLPVIALPAGDGYELQPVTLGDAGCIIADAVEAEHDVEVDAAGPDRLTFRRYVELLAEVLGVERRFVQLPPRVMIAALRLAGPVLRDTVLTREELEGLRRNMLCSSRPALGTSDVAAWLRQHGDSFGASYANDTLHRFGASRQARSLP